jgi:hypothetical protein
VSFSSLSSDVAAVAGALTGAANRLTLQARYFMPAVHTAPPQTAFEFEFMTNPLSSRMVFDCAAVPDPSVHETRRQRQTD